MYYVYIVKCRDNSLYTGWTTDLEKRLSKHNQGLGSKYTRSRKPVTLVYYEVLASKSEAMKREWYIKSLSREEKLAFIRTPPINTIEDC
ncbi:MAG: GIY-YIG nuclease family protein [Peptococcia bacterium]